MTGELIRMEDQPWHKGRIVTNEEVESLVKEVVKEIVEETSDKITDVLTFGTSNAKFTPTEVEVSNESPADDVKTTVKKKKRRTQAQMKAAKEANVQTTD